MRAGLVLLKGAVFDEADGGGEFRFVQRFDQAADGAGVAKRDLHMEDGFRKRCYPGHARCSATEENPGAQIRSITLGLAASTVFLAGCCTGHKTAQWEYMTKPFFAGSQIDADILNANAKDGWEYVSATVIPNDQNGGAIAVFKRRVQ